jgi:peptidoglycan hydrolase-like protein with peptidoglycan-binding domain
MRLFQQLDQVAEEVQQRLKTLGFYARNFYGGNIDGKNSDMTRTAYSECASAD